MARPLAIYDRKKNVRSWLQNNIVSIEAYFEDAIHFIIVSLTVQLDTKEIQDHKIQFLRSPYPDLCPSTIPYYAGLKGIKIEKGFDQQLRKLLVKENSCVHIHALLKDCADAFAQTQFKLTAKDLDGAERRKWLRGTLRNVCLAYSDQYNQDLD